ncbi:MAG: right-handed parallel beta-helix repeat-containing protein [Planctomycetota bacterium]
MSSSPRTPTRFSENTSAACELRIQPGSKIRRTRHDEDCKFIHNNGSGLIFANVKDMNIRNCQFDDSGTIGISANRGLWLDTSVNYVTIDDSRMPGNWGTGFYDEHIQGPTLIKNARVERHGYNEGSRTKTSTRPGPPARKAGFVPTFVVSRRGLYTPATAQQTA